MSRGFLSVSSSPFQRSQNETLNAHEREKEEARKDGKRGERNQMETLSSTATLSSSSSSSSSFTSRRRRRRRRQRRRQNAFSSSLRKALFVVVFATAAAALGFLNLEISASTPRSDSGLIHSSSSSFFYARAAELDSQNSGGRSSTSSGGNINDGTNSIVNFHRHHREVRKRLREQRRKNGQAIERAREGEKERKSAGAGFSSPSSSSHPSPHVKEERKNADEDDVSSIVIDDKEEKTTGEPLRGVNEKGGSEEENNKLTSLFKAISDRRRHEILAAMTDFAKIEAEKNGETFTDMRQNLPSSTVRHAEREEKKLKEYAKDPSIERNALIEKARKEDPTNPNVQPPIRSDEDSIIRIEYGTYDSCDTCELCHLGDAPVDGVEVNKHQEIRGNPGVSKEDMEDENNARKPVHCKECYGCNVRLSRIIKRTEFRGKMVQVFSGASGAAILKGKILKKDFLLSDEDDDGANDGDGKDKTSAGVNHHEELEEADAEMTVFVKAWCNFGRYAQNPENPKSGVPSMCGEFKKGYDGKCHIQGGRYGFGDCNFNFISSLDKLAHAANLSSVVPRSWTVEVKSFLPWDGFSTAGHKLQKGVKAQFYEKAPGVSIEAVLGTLDPMVNFAAFKKISHDNVIRAATFDLLFSESDRHGQNVFFSDEGEITLIDSEGTFSTSNSMLLPGHQKYEINRIGFTAITGCDGNCPGQPKPSVSPMVTLDYRCHVPGQYVGFDFPSGVEPFLKKIQGMSAKSVVEKFKMNREEHAIHLKRTVDEMLSLGFEGAMLSALARQEGGNGYPIGKYGLKYWYPITKACCGLETCPIHTTRMKERMIRDDSVTLKRDDPGIEAKTLWGDRFEAHATVDPELGLERLKTKILSKKQ